MQPTPQLSFKTWGGGGAVAGVQPGVRGGCVPAGGPGPQYGQVAVSASGSGRACPARGPGGGGGFLLGVGVGGLARGQGGVQPGVRGGD